MTTLKTNGDSPKEAFLSPETKSPKASFELPNGLNGLLEWDKKEELLSFSLLGTNDAKILSPEKLGDIKRNADRELKPLGFRLLQKKVTGNIEIRMPEGAEVERVYDAFETACGRNLSVHRLANPFMVSLGKSKCCTDSVILNGDAQTPVKEPIRLLIWCPSMDSYEANKFVPFDERLEQRDALAKTLRTQRYKVEIDPKIDDKSRRAEGAPEFTITPPRGKTVDDIRNDIKAACKAGTSRAENAAASKTQQTGSRA